MIAARLLTQLLVAARPTSSFDDERGVTTTEYAIMLVLVAIAVVIAVPDFRNGIIDTFTMTQDTLNTGLENASS